jgi:ribosomal protein S21
VSYNKNKRGHQSPQKNQNSRNRRNDKNRYVPPSCGKKPSNVTVVPRHNEHPEKAVKRFLKKCKKQKVIEIYRDKTDFYRKPSEIRRRKMVRRQRILKKQSLEAAKD